MWKGAVNLARGAAREKLIRRRRGKTAVEMEEQDWVSESARISGNEVINSCQLCYPHHTRAKVVEREEWAWAGFKVFHKVRLYITARALSEFLPPTFEI